MHKNFYRKFVIFAVILFMAFSPMHLVAAETLEEQLARLQQEIEAIKKEREGLQAQLDNNNATLSGFNAQLASLYAEMEIYNKEIAQLELEIQQVELQIDATEKEIQSRLADIAKSESSIGELEQESEIRIVNSYMSFRMYGGTDGAESIVTIDNVNDFFKTSSYKEIIQSDTNELLSKIAKLRIELLEKKKSIRSKTGRKSKEQRTFIY